MNESKFRATPSPVSNIGLSGRWSDHFVAAVGQKWKVNASAQFAEYAPD
jgi:hypothetical protein